MAPPPAVDCFAIAAPGLEPLVATELDGLGIAGTIEAGGVRWTAPLESVARANLWLRTASRVVVRVVEFRARTFGELERHARRVPWDRYVASGTPVRFRIASRKSRLYHTAAVAERFAEAAGAIAGATVSATPGGESGTRDDEDGYKDDAVGGQLFVVRIVRDVCTVSADSSGALLHRRGYRQAVAKAPLRETIAAAMVLGSEWPTTAPLVDPMCGSGTIPIEAALLARRIAPGLGRRFAFRQWPEFDAGIWARLVGDARARSLPSTPAPIRGSDRDAGAVEAARSNADRAGVSVDVEFEVRPLSAIEPPAGRGWLVTNPPYGVRVGKAGQRGEGRDVRDLYAALGNVVRTRLSGWTLALLSPGEQLERQVDLAFTERFRTVNGGIPVRLVTAQVGS